MLIGNGSVLHKSPARFIAGTTTSVEPQMRANFGKQGMLRNRFYQSGATTALSKYSIPEGTYAGTAWLLPQARGGMASFSAINGAGSVSGSANLGLPAAAALVGSGDITSAFLALIVSAVASLTGSGGITASIVGRLEAAASIAGSGDLSGAMGALASMLADISASGSVTGTPYASASASANIRGYGDLTPEGIRDAVWNAILSSYQVTGSAGNTLASLGAAPTVEQIAAQIRIELDAELVRITKVAKIHGVGETLVVTPTSRTAGDLSQTISTVGDTTTVSSV